MEKETNNQKLSKYTLLAYVYFFFNSLALPKGLLFTTVLSPLFYYRQLVNKRKTWWIQFGVFLVVFDCIHLIGGVDVKSFVYSNIYFIFCYFSVVSFYHFFNNYNNLAKLFRQVLVFNFGMVLVALPFYFMSEDYQDWFWWVNRSSMAVHEFPRLKLLTYEASYYSLLLVPVAYYYSFKLLFKQVTQNKFYTFLLVALPLALSMSFGVIGASILTAFILALVFWKKLLVYKRAFILTLSVIVCVFLAFLVLAFFFPDSPVTLRLYSIFEGTDTSANGRTTDSFNMAWMLASSKNTWFGIGLGQVKIQVAEIIRAHFNHWGNYPRYDIPNAMGETLAIFGIFGVVIRIGLQWYLFIKTRVKSNYYRLALFIFVFIYQFTGSFITNIVEYVIWMLAFSNVFEQFDVKPEAS